MSWTLIEHQALTSSVASVTLGSGGTIPQTYKTLMLLISARTDRPTEAGDNVLVRPNGSTSNLSSRRLAGSGTAAASYNSGTLMYAFESDASGATASTFSNGALTFPNYSGTTNKPVSGDGVMENNATAAFMTLSAGLWSNTAAITSIQLVPEVGPNFVSGSTFTLYGLA